MFAVLEKALYAWSLTAIDFQAPDVAVLLIAGGLAIRISGELAS